MHNIEENINRTLNSFNGIQRATPGDFFFTRINARLLSKHQTIWESTARFLSRPVIVISGLCLVIIINTLVILEKSQVSTSPNSSSSLALADEYTIAAANFYDNETSSQ